MEKTNTLLLSEESEERLEAWQKLLPADSTPLSPETKRQRKNRLQTIARRRRLETGIKLTRPRLSPATKELIISNVTIDLISGCWLWSKCLDKDGYGKVRHLGKSLRVHRVAWELWRGPIPEGLHALHNCPGGDRPSCCNPGHQFLGTNEDNMRDASKKERKNRKLTFDQAQAIRSDGRKLSDIAIDFNICASYACQIKSGKARTIIPNRLT